MLSLILMAGQHAGVDMPSSVRWRQPPHDIISPMTFPDGEIDGRIR
jgi:hypothetical protein